MDQRSKEILGPGWAIFICDRFIFIKFNHQPDSLTLRKLNRSRFTFCKAHPTLFEIDVWYAAESHEAWLEAQIICHLAQTWESVGETPPSAWDDCDPP